MHLMSNKGWFKALT